MADSTLLILAHPQLSESEINRFLLSLLERQDLAVSVRDLYALYPDFNIDVASEQQLLTRYSRIVLQFPVYWYSCPALLKHWFDSVWLRHFAYGKAAVALRNKRLQLIVSAGGPKASYGPEGKNQYSLDDFLKPFAQTAEFCQMQYQQPLILHNSYALHEADLLDFGQEYLACLSQR